MKHILLPAKQLRPYVTNTVVYLHRAMDRGKQILFEGAQGTFLDIDHGTYPYVTSSNTTAGGACTGTGVPPHRMDRVVGVMKAYSTRVGDGALPTEDAQLAQMLHNLGREFGATTGRKRRCGWFDAVATRYAGMINGIDEIAITNLDGLDQVDPIRICVGYQLHGKRWMFRRAMQLNSRTANRSTKKSLAGTRLYTLHANFRSFLRPRENMSDTSPN